ncbi:hypothetical protein [Paraburkholderia aspalathi]|uniref:hypothetical protein n=1 Tax=Paraburkholderia aspalathi TaxID=1324617 RepID=UPI0038BC31E8
MTVLDTENQHLSLALEQAREFLAQSPQQRAASDWLRHLRQDRDSRTFFNGNALRQAPMFAMKVAEEVAKAYLACADVREELIAPTGTQVRMLQATATALETELDAAGTWLISDATRPAFREPLPASGDAFPGATKNSGAVTGRQTTDVRPASGGVAVRAWRGISNEISDGCRNTRLGGDQRSHDPADPCTRDEGRNRRASKGDPCGRCRQ